MAYKVFIESGRGKNKTTMGSTPLKNKQSVVNWVKRNPIGNIKTPVKVFNTSTHKTITRSKGYFSHGFIKKRG